MLAANMAAIVNGMANAARVADANAAALAEANSEKELARTVVATIEARERAAEATAMEVQAAAERREADSRAAAAAQATRVAEASQAAAVEQQSRGLNPLHLFMFALVAVIVGTLGTMIWHRQQEPFVLKAKPAGS
jgi:hypothetical protein